ncbi:histidine kinase [Kitasatospora sp. NPDC057542]|uniref:histidine kinase n=1 Tax=Kitasatospora sp. NPDC057542 TaxID=3346162 RepID=UPI00369467AC
MRRSVLGWYGPDHRAGTDTLLLLGLLGLTTEEALVQWAHSDGPLRLPRTVVAALASLSLVFARRYPVASAVLPVLTGGLFNRAFPGLFSVFHLAYLDRSGPAMAGGAVIAVVSATGADSLVGWAGTTGSQLLVQAATLAVGLWLHGRRVLIRTLHEQVDVLRRERELRAEQARAAERARIAREMHDVLAHRLSLLVLHAGVLRDQARPEPSLPTPTGSPTVSNCCEPPPPARSTTCATSWAHCGRTHRLRPPREASRPFRPRPGASRRPPCAT